MKSFIYLILLVFSGSALASDPPISKANLYRVKFLKGIHCSVDYLGERAADAFVIFSETLPISSTVGKAVAMTSTDDKNIKYQGTSVTPPSESRLLHTHGLLGDPLGALVNEIAEPFMAAKDFWDDGKVDTPYKFGRGFKSMYKGSRAMLNHPEEDSKKCTKYKMDQRAIEDGLRERGKVSEVNLKPKSSDLAIAD